MPGMGGGETGETDVVDPRLVQAHEALGRRAWQDAYTSLSAIDSEHDLEPEDLESLAKASWWTGRAGGSIEARERAYAGYVERGDVGRAAFCALTLQREHAARQETSAAAGWLARAERLLEGTPESASHGYLALAHARAVRARGEFDRAQELIGDALEVAGRSTDRDLLGWSVMLRGMFLVDAGQVDEGWPMIDEVAAAAAGGELGAYTTGAVFCNVVSTCRDLADYRRASEWSDAATRWCERQAISGFPGICRVNRAEVMRLLGAWTDAEAEVRRACEELHDFNRPHAGRAYHELGEVRLRLGDPEGAREAFEQAREYGADPQPGLAMLLLAEGKVAAAAGSIRRSLEESGWERFERSRMLPAQAEIAREAGDAATARAAADELDTLAESFGTPAITAAAAWARGNQHLVEGDPRAAAGSLRRAAQLWRQVGAPYEAARAQVVLAEAHLLEDDADAAALEARSARSTFERLGAVPDADRARQLIDRATGTPASRTKRTFLFTDVVGSTSLLEAVGDEAWDDLRRWHDRALRSCFEGHGGEEIDHAGDGFFIAFPDPASAISCAVDVQRRLAEHRRDHGFAPQVRIGVHAAEALETAGEYTGKGVHAAARIGSLAAGGEIVASATTIDGLRDLPVSEPRTVHLKGIADPMTVVSIDWR
jgi:class 3 adenylate cyclase